MLVYVALALMLLSPLIVSLIKRGEPLALIIPVMVAYGSASIAYAGTASAPMQAALLALAVLGLVFGRACLWSRSERALMLDISFHAGRIGLIFFIGFATAIVMFAMNGIPIFALDPQTSRVTIFDNGYLGTVMVSSVQCALLVGGFWLIFGTSDRKRALMLLLVSAATLVLFTNRGLVIFPLLGLATLTLLTKPKLIPWTILFGLAGAIAVSVAGYLRDFGTWGLSYLASLELQGYSADLRLLAPILSYFRGTSEAMDLLIGSVPSETAHPMGEIFFSPLLSPLPGEQLSAGGFLKDLVGLDFAGFGLAMGGVGGFYLDFGPVGVFVGYFLFGVLLGVLRRLSGTDSRWTLMLAYASGHLILMNYSHPFPNLAFAILPILVFWAARPSAVCFLPYSVQIRSSTSWKAHA